MNNAYGIITRIAIYCDLSKAFDCLNFDIFLSKINIMESPELQLH